MAKRKTITKRKYIRYKPIEAATAEIALNGEKDPFKSDCVGLVLNESHEGCAILLLQSDSVRVGLQCVARVGTLPPLNAEIVWCTPIDSQVLKIGLKFLE